MLLLFNNTDLLGKHHQCHLFIAGHQSKVESQTSDAKRRAYSAQKTLSTG